MKTCTVKAGYVALLVKCFSGMHEVQSTIPSTGQTGCGDTIDSAPVYRVRKTRKSGRPKLYGKFKVSLEYMKPA